jgi:hypothetical protein
VSSPLSISILRHFFYCIKHCLLTKEGGKSARKENCYHTTQQQQSLNQMMMLD